MSKYCSLWKYIAEKDESTLKMTFDEIQNVTGFPIDHSFLKYKSELQEYGYQCEKIFMKEKAVAFNKLN